MVLCAYHFTLGITSDKLELWGKKKKKKFSSFSSELNTFISSVLKEGGFPRSRAVLYLSSQSETRHCLPKEADLISHQNPTHLSSHDQKGTQSLVAPLISVTIPNGERGLHFSAHTKGTALTKPSLNPGWPGSSWPKSRFLLLFCFPTTTPSATGWGPSRDLNWEKTLIGFPG